jgi:hypothetical protein
MYAGIRGINSMVVEKLTVLESKVTGSEKTFNRLMNELIGEKKKKSAN